MEGCSEFLSAAGLQSAIQKNARDRVRKEAVERKRSVLYLIFSYLREHNLSASADCLASEAQLTGDFEVCDNIDLDTILQEYQSYYAAKFNKHPKIIKAAKVANLRQAPPTKEPPVNRKKPTVAKIPEAPVQNFQFEIKRLLGKGEEALALTDSQGDQPQRVLASAGAEGDHPQRALCDFEGYSSEWREIAEVILKEIVPKDLGVKWGDCVGLERNVKLLKEAVVYPLLYPRLFSGLITPWKGVLLYGPPGTGKTLLSKAVACESKTTFFNVTNSCFINKWRGESEKMIKVLFDIARFYAPSTIFIDELDALACGHCDYQHEASKRFRSELLVQLDGILRNDDKVFVLATTNRPWDLDSAILRRFEKRILVDVPGEQARYQIFRYYFSSIRTEFSEKEFAGMARISPEFSGSDIKTTCKEACMRKLREGLSRLENREVKVENLQVAAPSMADVVEAARGIRPVTNARLQEKYLKWDEEFGCL